MSAPSTAKTGYPFDVYLRISPSTLGNVIRSLQEDFPENKTVKGREGIKLTPRMTASVSGMGFEIPKEEQDQVQAVSATEPTSWHWQVKPVQSGRRVLTFTLSGALTVEGKEVPRTFYEYQQSVEVAVSPMGFVQQYWQWLATTLVIPAVGALWAFVRKTRGNGAPIENVVKRVRQRRRESAQV